MLEYYLKVGYSHSTNDTKHYNIHSTNNWLWKRWEEDPNFTNTSNDQHEYSTASYHCFTANLKTKAVKRNRPGPYFLICDNLCLCGGAELCFHWKFRWKFQLWFSKTNTHLSKTDCSNVLTVASHPNTGTRQTCNKTPNSLHQNTPVDRVPKQSNELGTQQ